MSPTASALLSVVAAYLIGSIPFAYVIVRLVKGIDIRTVGSGNVGATNAGRVLGSKGFLFVFGLDLLKGWLPTIGLPALLRWRGLEVMPNLAILIAVGAILGHNFPIYLMFRGGKGVSTSLGAAIGLDWISAISAALVFMISIFTNRYMSVSSVAGASAFVAVHFFQVVAIAKSSPWDREHLPFSVLILGLYLMLIVRHRNNWRRLYEGTEPKVGRRKTPPAGRVAVPVLGAILGVAAIAFAVVHVTKTPTLNLGSYRLVQLERLKTGHQRATNPVFADDGTILAVLCPRYDRLMIYRVGEDRSLTLSSDVTLAGQPMALRASGNRLVVLERPSGDQRHLSEGYVQAYDLSGNRVGKAVGVGFYPTDLALVDDGKTAVALSLGRIEGNPELPPPSLVVVDLGEGRVRSRLDFEGKGEAPMRVTVSSTGQNAAVVLKGVNQVAAIDLQDRDHPRVLGLSDLPPRSLPYPSLSDQEWILMPVASDREFAVMHPEGDSDDDRPLSDWLVSIGPEESSLEVHRMGTTGALGEFPLRGAGNLGDVRPTGVACSSKRSLIAVTSRSGGVHLLGIEPTVSAKVADQRGRVLR